MIRVVLDTNVVISALLNPKGLQDRVLNLALHGHVQLYVSPAVVAEYQRVARDKRFKFGRGLIRFFWPTSTVVQRRCGRCVGSQSARTPMTTGFWNARMRLARTFWSLAISAIFRRSGSGRASSMAGSSWSGCFLGPRGRGSYWASSYE